MAFYFTIFVIQITITDPTGASGRRSTKKTKSNPEEHLMEKRIGTALILVQEKNSIERLNSIISKFGDIILGRQGLPLHHKNINVISLIFEGSPDEISSFTGQIGRLNGVTVKTLYAKF